MRQEELRAQNKQRVLEEALKCFYYEGIERTKVAAIAQKAGVTSMSVYRYYGDKESIVLETAMLFWNKLVDDMMVLANEVNGADCDGCTYAVNLLRAYGGTYRQNVQALLLLQEFDIYMSKRKCREGRECIKACYEKLMAQFVGAIKRGIEDGSVRGDINVADVSSAVLNMLMGEMQKLATGFQYAPDGQSGAPQRQIEVFCSMVESYIRAR